jgi:hypothetical protein
MVAHILSLRISKESRSLRRLVEYLSRIAVYQSENIGNNPKVCYGMNKFATIYSLSLSCPSSLENCSLGK